MDEEEKTLYLSYNGLGRNPCIWGIPYMTGLAVFCVFLLGGMVLGVFVAPSGWLFSILGVPILMFVKIICTNDDRAVEILLLEAKWAVIRIVSGNTKYFGGTMTITPITYGRKLKYVKRYFKKAISG